MHLLLQLLCWFSLAALVYIYAGYPLLVWMLGRWRGHTVQRAPISACVSVILVVHNEAGQIRRKLNSLLAMDRTDQIIEILVGSDGSTDDAAHLVQTYADPRVRWMPYAERRGKPSVINDLVPLAQGDIILLTDVRQDFAPDFLMATLPNFADARVGV
ncbi:MAG: glycosyltransferase, partial [Planctomycetaceae bacterium]|nr:glycosyltransferase [Planctomycetaceae bacterium]